MKTHAVRQETPNHKHRSDRAGSSFKKGRAVRRFGPPSFELRFFFFHLVADFVRSYLIFIGSKTLLKDFG